MKINARKMALKILNRIEIEKDFSHLAMNAYFDEYELADIDRRFISSMVLGILENKLLIDFYIRKFSKIRFGKLSHDIVNILRMGIYQIMFMTKVPESAAVNESVKLAKKISIQQGNFVNGVLRSFLREYKDVKLPDPKKHLPDHLSIKYSHPLWLVEKWLSAYGRTFTEALLKSNNQIPPLSIRVNTLKISREAYALLLEKANVDYVFSTISDEGIKLVNLNQLSVVNLPGFEKGFFQVQDESSMLIGKLAGVKPDDFVIDVCAAPGGKCCHVAQLMANKGKVVARDLHEHKLRIIRENADRLGIDIIKTEQHDAIHFDPNLRAKGDVVLVDAPCSGLGIIRRKPDIKYNKTEESLKELTTIQAKIIASSAEYVKSGGTLVYSTCTINSAENEDIVNAFLAHHDQFELVDISTNVEMVSTSKMITLFPNVHQTDGFFIAKMRKK